MPIEVVKRYTRQMIRDNPEKLFIFGDNWERRGTGGQAGEARGEPNAIGIGTKKDPLYNEGSFLTDAEYSNNITAIFADFEAVLDALLMGKTVVWPADGVGTGIARLQQNAPLTLSFINNLIESLKQVHGTLETES